jgi:Predicted dehydrogenases and related proteins
MIRVAVIGFGLAGRVFHAPLIATTEGLELAAIVSRRKDEIAGAWPSVRAVTDPQEVFADPMIDLVVVATPNDSHFDLAARALAAGKHVVVDKPFALTAAQAKDLIGKARGRLLTVFQNRRWDGDFLTLKKLKANGALGDIAFMESRFDFYRPEVRDRWRERSGPATGIWYDLGSHLLDQALQLFGRPVGITADLAARRPNAQTTDYFRVVLRYATTRVVLAGDNLAPTDVRFRVHGTGASFIKRGLDPQESDLAKGLTPRDSAYGRESTPARLVLPEAGGREIAVERGGYSAFYANVRDALHGVAPLAVKSDEALAVMELLEAGEESAGNMRETALLS